MLAVIGGTGFGALAGLEAGRPLSVETRFGVAHLDQGRLGSASVLFLARHGSPPTLPPHRINYRANILALKEAGATAIVGVNAVGSVDPSLPVPSLVVPDQIIDYTWGRAHTFFDEEIHHIDFTYPYSPSLCARLIELAREEPGIALRETGVYGATQGPRLETAAEVQRLARDGCHIVGMTGMPEAALAREAGLDYASLSVVVNAGAGLEGAIDLDSIEAAMTQGMGWVAATLRRLAAADYGS